MFLAFNQFDERFDKFAKVPELIFLICLGPCEDETIQGRPFGSMLDLHFDPSKRNRLRADVQCGASNTGQSLV